MFGWCIDGYHDKCIKSFTGWECRCCNADHKLNVKKRKVSRG